MRSLSYHMATTEVQNKIQLEDNRLIVKEFETTDADIVSYFSNLEESSNINEKFENALKVGVVAVKTIGVAGNVNYVEKAFSNLDLNFKQRIDQVFGDNGQFSNLLKGQFGEDGKLVKELFDPNREGSPLYSLKRELVDNLSEIRNKILFNAGVEATVEKSPQKGFDFEDYCEQKLGWIASIHSDKLERTSDIIGKVSGSKKGDFVLTLGDIGKKIVFEMKDRDKISLKDIQKELDESMENREADYGVFVTKNRDSLPDSVGWFNEYDGNHLVCALENNDGDTMIDGEIIHIAYKWSRAKLRLETNKEKKLDASFILEKISDIQTNLGELRRVKTQCTNIEKSAGIIKEVSKTTETQIKKDLDEILESLNEDIESKQE